MQSRQNKSHKQEKKKRDLAKELVQFTLHVSPNPHKPLRQWGCNVHTHISNTTITTTTFAKHKPACINLSNVRHARICMNHKGIA